MAVQRLLVLFCLTILAGCATGPRLAEVPTEDTSRSFNTVVVDAGHGGKDLGAYRRFGGAEKVATLDVAERLSRKLRESHLKVVMTRTSDVFIPLEERVAIENAQKNAVFVSIHFNDSRRRGIRGFETYYHSPSSIALANRIQSNLLTIPRSANRGVRHANFRVLRLAKYPAVLVECGFLSNPREGGEARDSDYRDELASRIADAIVEQRYGSSRRTAKRERTNASPLFENN
jgi:N-acetylmuramoyl-L-alanine amidase